MIKKLSNNWVWKSLSLVLAFSLWVVVINYSDPYITKSFKGIEVEKRNEQAITSQDQAITYLVGEKIDVILRGSRSKIERLDKADIVAYVDMQKVSITGAIDIEVEVKGDIDVLEKKPNNMQISLEAIKTVQKDIQVFFDGALAEGYVKLNPQITPNQIELTGPESKLAQVASVIATVKLGDASENITAIVTPKIQNSAGNDVLGLKINNKQIQIQVPIEKTKKLPVHYATVGIIDEAYRLISMSLDMEDVIVRGEEAILNEMTAIVIDDIDLSVLTDRTTQIDRKISDYLPEGITFHLGESVARIGVTIQPVISKEYRITSSDIEVKALGEGMEAVFVEEVEILVTLKGLESDLEAITNEALGASISLTDLGVGTHTVQLELDLDKSLEVATELPQVKVELSEIVVEEGT